MVDQLDILRTPPIMEMLKRRAFNTKDKALLKATEKVQENQEDSLTGPEREALGDALEDLRYYIVKEATDENRRTSRH